MIPFFRALLAAASCFGLTFSPFAASAATALPTLPAPSASFDSGVIHVDRYGSGARTIVFIPGLGCGPWSWAGQISRFSSKYTVYAVTLNGFDGRPFAQNSDLFGSFNNDFWKFAEQQKLNKPVVVGHSLGGTLAFLLAETHPEKLGGVVAVDGLPVFPMVSTSDASQRAAAADKMTAAIAGESHDQLLAFERSYMKQIGTMHDDLIEPAAQLEAKSEPAAIAAWMRADLISDLRPDLAKANVRIVELVPYAQPSPYSKDQTVAFYRTLVAGAPNIAVVPVEGSRHFAMLDQPAAVDAAITQALGSAQ